MTLQEFLDTKDISIDCTVYSHNSPIYTWYDNDPRYNCRVIEFGVVSETEMWVDIDEDEAMGDYRFEGLN